MVHTIVQDVSSDREVLTAISLEMFPGLWCWNCWNLCLSPV